MVRLNTDVKSVLKLRETAKLFHFCNLNKLVRPEAFGPYHVKINNECLLQSVKNRIVELPVFQTIVVSFDRQTVIGVLTYYHSW
jgi:hypothetical protein